MASSIPCAGILLVIVQLSVGGCGGGGRTDGRATTTAEATPAETAPAETAPAESEWYRKQAELRGRDNVLIGSVPYDRDRMWMSSRTEDAAELPEYMPFLEELHAQLEEQIHPRLPDVHPPIAPTIYGDMRDAREFPLIFDPGYMSGHVDVLVDTFDLIQRYLGEGTNRQYRIGVFEGGLVIYPDAIFLGEERFATAAALADRLPLWLSTLKFDDEYVWD